MIDWRSQYDRNYYRDTLIQVIKDHPTTVFVGAGLSVHAGYPLLEKLIEELINNVKEHRGNGLFFQGEWKQDAQICKEELGEANYYQVIIDSFNPDNVRIKSTSIHNNLIQIPFNSFVTTNFDSCITFAFRGRGERIEPLYYPNLSVPALREGSVQHIHGYIHPEYPHRTVGSIILTSVDFQRAYEERPGSVRDFLFHLFTQQNVMFLGFGFSDEILFDILEVVKERKGEKKQEAESRNILQTDQTTHFAILENKVVFGKVMRKRLIARGFGNPDSREESEKFLESAIRIEDAYLQSLDVTPIRYNPDSYHKSVENIIENLKNATSVLSSESRNVRDII